MTHVRQLWLLPLLGAACLPEFDARNSEVDRGRVLVVQAEPPEVRPGARVDYEALVVGPEGRQYPALRWTQCTTPKPLVGNNAVSELCLSETGTPLDLRPQNEASGPLPFDACARFGPDPPPGDARPRDPDDTGGFYQPVRVDAYGAAWLHLQRVSCNPRSAPSDVARDFARDYVPNENPHIESLELRQAGRVLDVPTVAIGASLELVLRWPTADAEPYVWIDPRDSRLKPRREALRVSWFATGGSFAVDAASVGEGDARTHSENRWTAPGFTGRAMLWAILRDSRGGSAYVEQAIDIF